MRLAILGGSFNPVHNGHLYLADVVLSSFDYDRVIFVPAYESPFKLAAGIGGSSQDRLDMLAAAVAADRRLGLDDCEIRREGVSYTCDTLEDIVARYRPDGKPALVIGDDLAPDFPKWKNADRILRMADVIVARRLKSAGGDSLPYPHRDLFNDVMDISSSAVRERITRGEAWRSLVPFAARLIIEERGLYGLAKEAVPAGLIARVEDDARRRLKSGRYLHSRGTALLCVDLCRRFRDAHHLDEREGYLAGIGHDICKAMTDGELKETAARDGLGFNRLETEKPGLLHGRAAAVYLRDVFGVENEAVLEAVRLHTSGRPGMGPLAKALYAADKIEPGRRLADSSIRERAAAASSLDEVFSLVLRHTAGWLKSKNFDILDDTRRLLEEYGGDRGPQG